jgi:prevent-host-death family protein
MPVTYGSYASLAKESPMVKLEATKARGAFSETVNRVAYGKERVVLARRGKAIAAIVPVDDLELLERLEDRIDLEDARRALADPKNRKSIPWKKLKADLGL